MLPAMGAGQGSRIKRRREELGLSKTDLAKAVGVSRIAIHNWEAADTMEIKRVSLKKLARALKVAEAHITDGGPVMPIREKAPPLDTELLVDVLVGLEQGLEGRTIAVEKRAELIVAIYEMFSEAAARPTRATILQFARRVA